MLNLKETANLKLDELELALLVLLVDHANNARYCLTPEGCQVLDSLRAKLIEVALPFAQVAKAPRG